MSECSACGFGNPDEARFCGQCGAALHGLVVCPGCGVHNPGENAYCNACGRALARGTGGGSVAGGTRPDARSSVPERLAREILAGRDTLEGERKQVTVLFVDVVGSTKLAERTGPEQWRVLMDRFFVILVEGVHRFEGIIDRFTGDGVMAVFGAPIADEHHALHGCHAALYLCHQLAGFSAELRREQGLNLLVRLGLNSGEVVVGVIGEDLDIKYTATGHTVALAKRMEGLAEPGKVYLTESAASEVRGYFRLRDLGAYDVAGVDEPVEVFELTGLGPLRTSLELARAHGLSGFVGRDAEIRTLQEARARADEGNGQVVYVVGEAGVGKSRLLYEFVTRCREQRAEVWQGHCRARGETLALMPLLELLRAYFEITERDAGSAARDKIAGRVLLLDPELRAELPLVFELLGVSDPTSPVGRIDPDARQRRLFATLNRILTGRRQEAASVLVLEDLQWIDPGSAAFLESLVDALPGTRTLLLVSFRPGVELPWMQRSYCGRLALAPLAPDPSDELVHDLLGDDPSLADLAGQISDRAGGNPFFIEELVRGFVDDGSLAGERGAYRLAREVDQEAIPPTVQAVIADRLDRLKPREKRLLETAAIIGRDFEEPLLVTIAGVSESETRATLRALLDGELIYERALAAEPGYSFAHQLIVEVAYGSQLTEPRARLHALAARGLEELYPQRLDELAGLISHHLEQASEPLAAARWGARAAFWAGRADEAGAMQQWRRVSGLSDAAPSSSEATSIGIWSRIGIMQYGYRLGTEPEQIRQAFEQAKALAERSGDVRSLAMVLGMYAYTRVLAGDAAAYVDMGLESVRLAEEAGDPAMQVALTGAPNTLEIVGRWREALEMMKPWFARWAEDPTLGAGLPNECPYAQCIALRAQIRLYLGELTVQEARAETEQAIALALKHFDADNAVSVYSTQTSICFFEGDGEAALDCANRALEHAERAGSLWAQSQAHWLRGLAHAARSEWQQAIEDEQRSLEIARDRLPGTLLEPLALAQLANAYVGAGQIDRAREAANEAVALAARRGVRFFELIAQLALADVLIAAQVARTSDHPASGAIDQIERTLARIETLIEQIGAIGFEPWLHEARGGLAQLTGDTSAHIRELNDAQQQWQAIGAGPRAAALSAELALITA